MCSKGYGTEVFVFYDDNRVYMISPPGSMMVWGDFTRPDDPTLKPVRMAAYYSVIVAAYEDGQIWGMEPGNVYRIEEYERLNPTSDVDAPEGKSPPSFMPNPTAGPCQISYLMTTDGSVSLYVFDATGRVVRHLLDGPHPAGDYWLTWDGRDDGGREVAAGVYFAHVTTAQGTTTGRVVLAR
jgi:hypothetical protein